MNLTVNLLPSVTGDGVPEPLIVDIARWMLCLFAFSIPAEAVLILPGIGSLSRAIGIALIATALLGVLRTQRLRALPGGLLSVLAFCLWSAATLFWSLGPVDTAVRALTYFQLAIMLWIVWQYAQPRAVQYRILQSFVLGALVTGAGVIHEFRTLNLAALKVMDVRLSAFGTNPNEQGITLVLAIPMALFCLRQSARTSIKLMNAAAIVVGAVAVALTASRAAFIALVIAAACGLWMIRDARLRVRVATLVLGAVAAVTVVTSIPAFTWDRIATIGAQLRTGDLNQRIPIWEAGIRAFEERPVIGVGAGAYQDVTEHTLILDSNSAHNTYLGILVEQGFIGFILFTALLVSVIRAAWSLGATERRLMFAILIPLFVGMITTELSHRKAPWLVFAVCLVMASESRSRPAVIVSIAQRDTSEEYRAED